MKNSKLILGLAIAAIGFTAFTNVNKDETPKHGESTIEWTAYKVIGGSHNGNIAIKENNVTFDGAVLTGGTIVADMTTISNIDLEGEWNDKLVGHLNSDDFFATAKHTTATIKTTNVTAGKEANTYNVTADLTIKGITNSQTFVAHVLDEGHHKVLTASLEVDRTKYEIKYGSNNFFEGLGDKAISDNFTLKVTVYVH